MNDDDIENLFRLEVIIRVGGGFIELKFVVMIVIKCHVLD